MNTTRRLSPSRLRAIRERTQRRLRNGTAGERQIIRDSVQPLLHDVCELRQTVANLHVHGDELRYVMRQLRDENDRLRETIEAASQVLAGEGSL